MPRRVQPIRRVIVAALLTVSGAAGAQTVVRSARPVADAILKLEKLYGWPITYEDPPWVYKGDVEDVTSRVRKDGKRAGDGVPRILRPRSRTFTFKMEDGEIFKMEDVARPGRGARSAETAARAAILSMLKAYTKSVGNVEMFALTDSDGIFHVVPVQRKDASGKLERIVPLLDTPVSIPGKPSNLGALVGAVCRSLAASAGARVDLWTTLQPTQTYIVANPGETARSVLSRLFAEPRLTPTSWALFYEPTWGYMLNIHRVDTSDPR